MKDRLELSHSWETDDILLFDFSTDGNFLVIQTIISEIRIYETSGNFAQVDMSNFDRIIKQDWSGEGMLISPVCSFIRSYYSRENSVTNIVRVSDNCIAVGDDSGSVL